LDKLFGAVKEQHFSQSLSVGDLLRALGREMPDFTRYAGFGPKDKHPYGLLVWRDRGLLTLEDILDPNDEIELIVMVTGG
jgi:hypothetical protein